MPLPASQFKVLHSALLSAFPDYGDLAQMVRFELGENLDAIVGEGALNDVVFKLITWVDAKGRIADLVIGARKENPDNPELAQVQALLQGEMPSLAAAALVLVPVQLGTKSRCFYGREASLHETLDLRLGGDDHEIGLRHDRGHDLERHALVAHLLEHRRSAHHRRVDLAGRRQQGDQPRDRALVHAAGHLVEEQQPRPRGHCPRHLQPLPLAGGELELFGLAVVIGLALGDRAEALAVLLTELRPVDVPALAAFVDSGHRAFDSTKR